MRSGLFFTGRTKLVAMVVGVALAGVPMVAFNLWLDRFIDRQGHEEVELMARRALALADARVGQVADSLVALAARGIDSCRSAYLESLRQATFATGPIKEISVIAPDGRTLCSDLNLPLGARKVVLSQRLTAAGDYMMELVRLGENPDPMVRVRRVAPSGNSLAALMRTELFLPQVSTEGGQPNAHARLLARDGTTIVESGRPIDGHNAASTHFTVEIASTRFEFTTSVALPREIVITRHASVQALGSVITGVIAIVILGCALVVPARQRNNPIAEIERAIGAGEFVPYIQPIVDITNGRLRGGEVLVRWRKADGTLVLPGTFIPLVESSGLIVELTRALMRSTRDEIGAAYGKRPHLVVGFNLAAEHFGDETIVSDICQIFENSPIRLNQLVLEVTERQPLESLTETRRVIAALQGHGVRIAIDDVGSGHCGLTYMLKLGVDIIKIDKMFVDAIDSDSNSTTIIETLVDLARNMRMHVVAEGVESFEQVAKLREIGVVSAQGYVFAPPLPASSFLQLVEAIDPVPLADAERDAASPAPFVSAGSRFAA